MRIQYRIRDGYAEIVRCFGTGETVVVPEKIGEITVRAVAAYTFSDKKSSEDQDVREYRTEDGFLEEDREQLLAGEKIKAEEFYALGEGGLCLSCPVCTFPNCGFGKGGY